VNDLGLEVIIDYGEDGPAIGRKQKKKINFKISNHTHENWEGSLELLLPPGWKGAAERIYELNRGAELSWTVEVESDGVMKPYYELGLKINRYHDNSYWNTHKTEFTLVAATHWKVWGPGCAEGKDIICPGNRIEFERGLGTSESGVYLARTILTNPAERKVRLIAATGSPVRMSLDGKTIIDARQKDIFKPARVIYVFI
jgi:hypothetical protein